MKYRYQTADPMLYSMLKEFARKNRRHQTEAESLLWENLRYSALGATFKRQHIIGAYIADFACLDANLVIEVDGGYHAQYEQQARDAYRTSKLNDMGFHVMRFNNNDIIGNIDSIVNEIFSYVRGYEQRKHF